MSIQEVDPRVSIEAGLIMPAPGEGGCLVRGACGSASRTRADHPSASASRPGRRRRPGRPGRLPPVRAPRNRPPRRGVKRAALADVATPGRGEGVTAVGSGGSSSCPMRVTAAVKHAVASKVAEWRRIRGHGVVDSLPGADFDPSLRVEGASVDRACRAYVKRLSGTLWVAVAGLLKKIAAKHVSALFGVWAAIPLLYHCDELMPSGVFIEAGGCGPALISFVQWTRK